MVDRGNLYVVSAPSGTGKTTLVKALIDSLPNITVSISHTTRPKRSNETHGVNYFFIDKAAFDKMIAQGDFLEYASIFDHLYGTTKHSVTETLAKGTDVILEIDWQGRQQIKRLFPESMGIFILPPSYKDLHERLTKRNQDKPNIIKKRLNDAKETVSHMHEFEYVVINDDVDRAVNDLKTIVLAGRLREVHQAHRYANLIQEFI